MNHQQQNHMRLERTICVIPKSLSLASRTSVASFTTTKELLLDRQSIICRKTSIIYSNEPSTTKSNAPGTHNLCYPKITQPCLSDQCRLIHHDQRALTGSTEHNL